MKKYSYLFLIMICVFLVSCNKNGKDKELEDNKAPEQVTATPVPSIIPEEEIEEIEGPPEGHIRSFLTGLWVPEEIASKRPYAIQFSNFKSVSNQSGIGQAEIVYEALVEGGITRMLGIGQNYTGDRIGSMRSSRHYFVSIADEYDAIYIHYGKTKYAVKKLKELDMNNLDGETGIDGNVFYRDKSIKAPHNAFTSIERIQKGIEKRKYETLYQEGYEPHFNFYSEDTKLPGTSNVNKLTSKFSYYTKPYFEYNAEEKLYHRYQFGDVHKDSITGEQLKFKNIIVQFVDQYPIDRNDYQTMDFTNATGKGYYITNGKMVPITWKKKESSRWMRYYDESGAELTINQGKTFVVMFPEKRTKDIVLE